MLLGAADHLDSDMISMISTKSCGDLLSETRQLVEIDLNQFDQGALASFAVWIALVIGSLFSPPSGDPEHL